MFATKSELPSWRTPTGVEEEIEVEDFEYPDKMLWVYYPKIRLIFRVLSTVSDIPLLLPLNLEGVVAAPTCCVPEPGSPRMVSWCAYSVACLECFNMAEPIILQFTPQAISSN